MTLATGVSAQDVALNRPLYLFYSSGFLFVGGGFVLMTSGADLRVAPELGAGSTLSQSILAFYYCTGAALLFANANAVRVFKSAWPALLLPLLALISVSWSTDQLLSLRRAAAFSGTMLFGLSLGAAYNRRDLVALITRSLVLAIAISCAVVVFVPQYGMHQFGEAIQAVHANLWRGIFAHRNTLGLWAGISVATVLIYGRFAFRPALRLLALILALACLVGANSGAGYAVCVTMILTSLSINVLISQPAARRETYLLLAISAAIIALMMRDYVETWSLSVLGKSSDLTGRTLLWHYIFQITDSTPSFLGSGYFVGFFTLNTKISAILQTTFGSAHNGYLETFIYMGYIGLAVCIVVLLWLFCRAVRQLFESPGLTEPYLQVFPVGVILVVSMHNWVESTIVLPNNLNALLIATMAGTLTSSKR